MAGVSSFTWTAMIFPENTTSGPLIERVHGGSECFGLTVAVWMYNQKLLVGVCNENGNTSTNSNNITLSINEWHQVAVSYDAKGGAVQSYVDGHFTDGNIGIFQQKLAETSGSAIMGAETTGRFQGKVACMRMWSIARDLGSMRMDTPLCAI